MFVDSIVKFDLDNYNKELWFVDYSKIFNLEDLPGEKWENVGVVKNVDFKKQYETSNFGRVKSCGSEDGHTRKEKILKQSTNRRGYKFVNLSKNGNNTVVFVHTLVANAFLCNDDPVNKTEVNHIDENTRNNCAYNLEWCTHLYNMRYGTRTERTKKPVFQFDLDGNFIKRWDSIIEAEQEGFKRGGVCLCCNDKISKYKGFIWIYEKSYMSDKKILSEKIYSVKKREIPVVRLQKDYTFVKRYDSSKAVKDDGFNAGDVTNCCKKNKEFHKGYIWMYEKEYLELIKQS